MPKGAITGYIDVAQLVLYAFWVFFAGLIFYLRREDKREGYPLQSERTARTDRVKVQGFPPMPKPKIFRLPHGGEARMPNYYNDRRDVAAEPSHGFPGAPLVPTGDPMRDGVGPAAFAERRDEPEKTIDGLDLIVPMRVQDTAWVEARDPDPRGMPVVGADGKVGGTVRELWVDRSEPQVRYLELELAGGGDAAGGGGPVLLPITMCLVHGAKRRVEVSSILGSQFAGVPRIKSPDRVTKLEEDKISGYYAGGQLYATPDRLGPIL